jgi:prepilin-type N-terminal cleavage/methylation domain-containing protein
MLKRAESHPDLIAPAARIGSRRAPSRAGVPAFTLVEMIVVIVILGILAGVMAPAVLRSSERLAEGEARAAQRLLTIAAERDALSSGPLAIEYSDRDAELRLLVRRGDSTEWRPDGLVLPVVFSNAKLAQCRADGRALPQSQWRIELSQVQARPAILLNIEARSRPSGRSNAAARAWQVWLAPDAPAATRSSGSATLPAADRSIDLDANGKGEKAW